jgi:hypothetical protein
MIFDESSYRLLPKSEATYLMKIGKFWYVGHTVNMYNRAKYRKSVLLSGKCNETLVQETFNKLRSLPKYRILSIEDKERSFFKAAVKKFGKRLCLNTLSGGSNVSSHRKCSLPVYKRISTSLGKKYRDSKDFRRKLKRALRKSALRRQKPVSYEGQVYRSLNELSEKTGIPRGSIGHLVRTGRANLL